MIRGRALADAVITAIEENPEDWDQRLFACGTSKCFAGWALALNGYTVDRYGFFKEIATGRQLDGDDVSGMAQELMEISGDQAEKIFYYFPARRDEFNESPACSGDSSCDCDDPVSKDEQLRRMKARVRMVLDGTF